MQDKLKLKYFQTSASLKKENFRFILERLTSSKNAGNVIIYINSFVVIAKDAAVFSVRHNNQYECICLAVISATFIKNYILYFL